MSYVLIPACAVVLGLLAWRLWQGLSFVIAIYKDSREDEKQAEYEATGRLP